MEGESTHFAEEREQRHEASHYPDGAPGGRDNDLGDELQDRNAPSGAGKRDDYDDRDRDTRRRSLSRSRSRSPPPRRRSRDLPPSKPASAPKQVDPSNIVGVFGLSLRTEERDLYDEFGKSGQVEKVVIVMDQRTGKSRGFGFVTMASVEDADRAIKDLNGLDLHGRRIRVDFSATKRPHDPTPGIYKGIRRDDDFGGRYAPPPPRYGDRYGGGYGGDRYGDRWAPSSGGGRPPYDDPYYSSARGGGDDYYYDRRPPPPPRDYYPPRDEDRYASRSSGRYRSRSRSPPPRRRSPSPRRPAARDDDY